MWIVRYELSIVAAANSGMVNSSALNTMFGPDIVASDKMPESADWPADS